MPILPIAWRIALAPLALPIIRALPRGKSLLYRAICANGFDNPHWKSISPRKRVFFDRSLQAYVCVDLADWAGRAHYFYGYYFDRAHRLLLRQILRTGDTYIDIGANYGFHTLFASRVVGNEGQVHSFEPNPQTYQILAAHVAINGKSNVTTYPFALSNSAGTSLLRFTTSHSGTATLRPTSSFTDEVSVTTKCAIDVISPIVHDAKGLVVIKIDTEGYEQQILCSILPALDGDRFAVAVEVTDSWLRQLGGSAEELYGIMANHGFIAQSYGIRFKHGLVPVLESRPLRAHLLEQHDVLFVRPNSVAHRRLTAVRSRG